MLAIASILSWIIGGWEIILVVAILLILFFARFGIGSSKADPGSGINVTGIDFRLWIAQGFGIGRIAWGPGTFGSLVGVLWLVVLLESRNVWILLGGTVAGVALSIWLCGVAEKILKQPDPGSVVLDEISAMPLCFLSWVAISILKSSALPTLNDLFGPRNWPLSLGIFVAFRFFDIVKPWPVRQSQSLPGGWGITMDDVLAALYVNVAVMAVYWGRMLVVQG